jgi:hypothetical protein
MSHHVQFADHNPPSPTLAPLDVLVDPNRMDFEIVVHSAGCSGPNTRETWVVMLNGVEICRHWVPSFYTAAPRVDRGGRKPGRSDSHAAPRVKHSKPIRQSRRYGEMDGVRPRPG